MSPTALPRAGIYSRQSRDKTKSIEDQTADNRAVAEAEGFQVKAEYSDGVSASRFATKPRDDWQRLLADVDAGKLDVLVLWESSRGDRTPETWLALLSTCRKRGVQIHVTTHRRTYDMTNPRDWRTLAEDGIDNAYESEKIALRIRRGQASSARAGRPSQGRTPFGYRRVYDPKTGALAGQEPDPKTAPIVREIIERAAKSVPISEITRSLNDRSVPTIGGAKKWYRARVRDLAMNPAYAGKRVYNGAEFDGDWAPLVDPAIFYAARRVMTQPGRATVVRPGRQRHLLSYLAVSGPCGTPLTAARGAYRCALHSCVSVRQADADELVTEVILARLAKPDAYSALRQAGDDADQEVTAARQEAVKLRAQLDEWRMSAARGKTTPETMAVIEAELTGQIRAADRRAERAAVPPALRQVLEPGADVRARWKAGTLPARRDVIRTLVEVRVWPVTTPGSRIFEPERIEITWKT